MQIKNSLKLLQIEKMVIILKELEHIETILDFFYGYEKNDKNKEEHENKPIKRNISYLKYDIRSLRKRIYNLKNLTQDIEQSEAMLFIINYDYIRTQIEDMLRVIQALYNKMQQLFGETLNQYLPYPVLGRRYSNNGIMMYLNNYYREMSKKFSEQATNELILGWNYTTGFHYRIFINREIERESYENDTYNDYIDLPYWYYDLPMLLPSITHEVTFISLRNPKKNIKKSYDKLHKSLKNLLEDTSNNFIQKVQEIIGYDKYAEDLSKVIFCDVVGYKTHGMSYVYALFHNIIGEKIAKDCLKVTHEKENLDSRKKEKESYDIVVNEWSFVQKKDHNILRLHFILSLCKKNEMTKSMLDLLNSIMPLDKESNYYGGFSKVYKEYHPNFYSSYKAVQLYLQQLFITIIEWEEKNQKIIKKIELPKNSPNFTQLWEKRFELQNNSKTKNSVLHQNNFRQEIHAEVSEIEYLKRTKEPIIYLLELGKSRKDIKQTSIDINASIENVINSKKNREKEEKKVLNYFVYGIYDWLTLTEKSSQIDIVQRINQLCEVPKQEPTLKFFKTKQVLMKVNETISGNQSKKNEKNFAVVFNIEIAKRIDNKSCTNGYDSLKTSIEKIVSTIEEAENKMHFYQANIYKSLGPKDLTLIVENASLGFIFDLLTKLNKENENLSSPKGRILRTFTMLCSERNITPHLEKGFVLVSYLRITNSFKKEDTDKIKDAKTMLSMHEITGVMDYRVQWKSNIKISDVLDFYNKMLEDRLLTDFQTKIEKEIIGI